MKRIGILAIMALIALSGCGRENSCSVAAKSCGTISAEEVSAAAAASTTDSNENYSIIPSVGGQLLKLAYTEYRTTGYSENELNRLPTSLFSHNLARLYRDVKAAVE